MKTSVKYLVVILIAITGLRGSAALVGNWKLNETANPSGNTIAYDASGNALNGLFQPVSGPGPVVGSAGARSWTGTSADFNGSNDEVYIGTPAVLNNLASNFTVMAWINPDDISGTERVFAKDGIDTTGWGFGKRDGFIRLTTWGRVDFESSRAVLQAGKWQHIAVTFAEESPTVYRASFYLNGAFAGSATHTQPAGVSQTRNWFIGSHGRGERFAGRIDDVRLYDTVLTDDEIVGIVCNGGPFEHRIATPVFKYTFPESFDGTSRTIHDTWLRNDATMDFADGGEYIAGFAPPGKPGGSITGSGGGHGRTDALRLLNTTDIETFGGCMVDAWIRWEGTYTDSRKIIDYAGTDYLRTSGSKVQFNVSGTIVESAIVGGTWYHVQAYFDTLGNAKTADPSYAGQYRIVGNLYLYVDGQLQASAAAVTKSGFGDSLNRQIGINHHPTGGEYFQGHLYAPSVYLGVGIPPPVGTLFIIR